MSVHKQTSDMTDGSSTLRILSGKDVETILDELSDTDILDCVKTALIAYSAAAQHGPNAMTDVENIQCPARISTQTRNHNILYMPSRLAELTTTSVKIVSVPKAAQDKAALPASTVLIDENTGRVRAMMNATSLTAVRTAAASALALSLSLSVSSAKRLLIFGSGLQALWHAKLVACICPSLEVITMANGSINARTENAVARLQTGYHQHNRKIKVSCCTIDAAVGELVSEADVICCCTPSTDPLFSAGQLKPKAAISLIGSYKPNMREVDLMPLFKSNNGVSPVASRIVVDSKEACLKEAGELHHLRKAIPGFPLHRIVEVGSLLSSSEPRSTESQQTMREEVTVFKCVGFGAMDSAISALVLAKAVEMHRGMLVPY